MNDFCNYNDNENPLLNILINKGTHIDPYVRIPERYRRNRYSIFKSISYIKFK